MSESASFLTSLLGRKAQLKDDHLHGYRPGATGEIVCIHEDNGGNLRYTLLMEDGGLVCVHDEDFKIVK
ncbi:hypothetical protein AYO44_04115 [Planctomycetaceae bacterium SCGC AG-212-F19]|nr:hypothetical protein AYO44_04115 [Planctomycetaceae bacterium SCGC AG-212-F19]